MKTMNPLPDLNFLKECFIIDPSASSGLRWVSKRPLNHFKNSANWRTWHVRYADKSCGYLSLQKYFRLILNNIKYPVHRIIFAIHNNTTDFLGKQIDHIDGNALNNCPQNLRLASASQNQFNRKRQKNNATGHKNISFIKKSNRYHCAIRVNGKDIFVGLFDTIKEAVIKRDLKTKELMGEYSRS